MNIVVLEKDGTVHGDWTQVAGTEHDPDTKQPEHAFQKAQALLHLDAAIYRLVATTIDHVET